jgi:small multidrug resistance pump
MHWFYLGVAIIAEVIGTSSLRATDGFTRWWPSVAVVLGYGISFYFMSLTLRAIPMGITYAVWSGVGIALISMIGWIVYRQHLDTAALIGISLIVAGVVVIYGFSKTTAQ